MMSDTPTTVGIKACSLCGETTRVIRANGLCCHCDFEGLSKIPTPRTNVVIMQCHSAANVVRAYMKMVSHAETLERELAAMTKRADEMERLKEHNGDMFYRIERELTDLKARLDAVTAERDNLKRNYSHCRPIEQAVERKCYP